MEWRPDEGWENGWDSEREEDGMFSDAEIYELGADAMLRVLMTKFPPSICLGIREE